MVHSLTTLLVIVIAIAIVLFHYNCYAWTRLNGHGGKRAAALYCHHHTLTDDGGHRRSFLSLTPLGGWFVAIGFD